MNILIAEDDLASRKYLTKVLEQYGQVDGVIDGIEAVDFFLEKIETGDIYDLVCLDIMMPRVDGYKALDAIRDIEEEFNVSKRCKIIMTSALNEMDQREPSKEHKHDGYLMKPIDMSEMEAMLKKLELIQ
ncbi:MAG: response regulator [Lachnospiraceae bacterium]|nr:response regulator [Lachnospiraceae bacterium]